MIVSHGTKGLLYYAKKLTHRNLLDPKCDSHSGINLIDILGMIARTRPSSIGAQKMSRLGLKPCVSFLVRK